VLVPEARDEDGLDGEIDDRADREPVGPAARR
jgi:hypothetical protein